MGYEIASSERSGLLDLYSLTDTMLSEQLAALSLSADSRCRSKFDQIWAECMETRDLRARLHEQIYRYLASHQQGNHGQGNHQPGNHQPGA